MLENISLDSVQTFCPDERSARVSHVITRLISITEVGAIVQRLVATYQIKNVAQQMLVFHDDPGVVQGALSIQESIDLKTIYPHPGVDSILRHLPKTNFVRFKIGIGSPDNESVKLADYVLGKLSKDNQKEMDLFGYALDITAQALQHYAFTNDIKKTKKKFTHSKKLPSKLRTVRSPVILAY